MADLQHAENEQLLPSTDRSLHRPPQSDDEDTHDDVLSDTARHDREILDSEDEREKLLIGNRGQGRLQKFFNGSDTNGPKRKRRRNRNAGRDEVSELMYEMEEGGEQSNSDASRGSSESDAQRLHSLHAHKAVRLVATCREVLTDSSLSRAESS
jgi:hypothetical protein